MEKEKWEGKGVGRRGRKRERDRGGKRMEG